MPVGDTDTAVPPLLTPDPASVGPRDSVSQTSTAVSTSSARAGPAVGKLWSRRFLRAYAIGTGVWLLQCSVLAVDPGLGGMRPGLALASLAVAILASTALGLRKDLAGRIQASIGALAGVAASLVQLMLMAALPGSRVVPDLGWAAVSVAVAAATLAGTVWSSPLAADRWGRCCAIAAAVAGLVLMYLAGTVAVRGTSPLPAVWTSVAAALWTGSLGLLVGIRIGDLSLVASRRSIARRERFRIIAEALPIPIVLISAEDHRVLFANKRSLEQFFLPEDTVRGRTTDSFYVAPEDQRRVREMLRLTGSVENCEIEMRRSGGSTFWALISARSILFAGDPAILASICDITDRKAAEAALLASEIRYALIARAANDGIWDWDLPSGAVYFSTRWKEIVGVEEERGFTTIEDWLSRVHPDDNARLRGEIEAHVASGTAQLESEYRILHGDGRYCWMQCRAITLRDSAGAPIRMAGSQSDITLRKTYEINLLNAAYEDRLTGVNNRVYFSRLVEARNSAQAIEGTAILLLNVDQFRRLNDSLGNGAGDALLIAIARRLAGRVEPEDALSRIGSDEFAIWLGAPNSPDSARALAETLLADLAQPYALGDVEMSIGVSIGIAAPALGDAECGTELLRNARLALDRAKLSGGARTEFFDGALLRAVDLEQRLSKDLASAERLGQIFFEYQPIVSLDAGGINTILGFEALMRWRHPELGTIAPGRFIPIAEQAGLIGRLGLLAIECAAGEISRWSACGQVPDEFSIAVNLSNRQISDRAGVQRMHALLDRLAIAPGRLKLEITESVLMSDPEAMATTLHEFKLRGIELALDDFGTGYSSLSYLHRFPLDVLKIDRSFVSRMLRAPEALRLVRSIIELSHDLGLKVVAEGVEAAEECDLLRQLGCDHAQGYYFSPPVSSDAAQNLLERGVL
jgi:diguanylate cyclase (GGDEF)-like protein/PAS domain S-box-containing protein